MTSTPAVVGRPEITPLVLIVKPSGNAPDSMFQLYGPNASRRLEPRGVRKPLQCLRKRLGPNRKRRRRRTDIEGERLLSLFAARVVDNNGEI